MHLQTLVFVLVVIGVCFCKVLVYFCLVFRYFNPYIQMKDIIAIFHIFFENQLKVDHLSILQNSLQISMFDEACKAVAKWNSPHKLSWEFAEVFRTVIFKNAWEGPPAVFRSVLIKYIMSKMPQKPPFCGEPAIVVEHSVLSLAFIHIFCIKLKICVCVCLRFLYATKNHTSRELSKVMFFMFVWLDLQ